MGKVYRLHEGAEGTGWFTSKIFNDEELETILTSGKEVANSIPSPFARIDLVNEAFRWVAKNNIEGNKAQHKLVSDALDIGQLIFYSDKFKNEIEVVDYSPKQRISEKFGDVVSKHRELATTFEVYWEQDAGVYNFNETDSIHFVLFNKEIIGATSPKSLFFSAPIKRGLRNEINLQRAAGVYFGDEAVPLYKREWDFVEYLFVLAKQPLFADYFSDLYEYLEKTKEAMDVDRRKEINELNKDKINEYDKCHVTGESTNYCKIINYTLHIANEKIESIENESDFVIDPDFEVEGRKPLVLPNGVFTENWIFTTKDIKWDSNKYRGKIPEKNLTIEKSRLPIQGGNYPWLSVGNFLTDKIVELPYEIDSDNFRTAEGSAGNKYLLPLTEIFFNYFSAHKVSDIISIKEMNQGTVIVSLSIKTKGGYVKFEKKYRTDDKIKLKLHLSILPFVKIEDETIPIRYNVGIIDADLRQNHQNNFALSFFKKGEHIESNDFVIRAPGELKVKSYYTSTETYFDAIELLFNGHASGFILPNMRSYIPNSEPSEFSVDFGTTNTHIEYSINKRAENSLKFDPSSIWASLLNRRSKIDPEHEATEQLFETEMVPYSLGCDTSEVGFPLRTALVENKSGSQLHSKKQLFKHANNFLLYETKNIRAHLDLFTNLKWSNISSETNLTRVKLYIEYLIRLIKYKALTLSLNLNDLKITWFYPISMSSYHRGRLASVWLEKVKEVFGINYNKDNVKSLPESVGPYPSPNNLSPANRNEVINFTLPS